MARSSYISPHPNRIQSITKFYFDLINEYDPILQHQHHTVGNINSINDSNNSDYECFTLRLKHLIIIT